MTIMYIMVSKISQDVSDILATDKSGYGVDYKSLSREVACQTKHTRLLGIDAFMLEASVSVNPECSNKHKVCSHANCNEHK